MFFSHNKDANNAIPKIYINCNNTGTVCNSSNIFSMQCVNSLPVLAIRFMGVYFDPALNFKHHLQHLSNKLSTALLYFLRSTKNFLTFNALKFVYYALFHSHLIYGIQIWSCTSLNNISPLIVKQKWPLG